MPKRKLHTPDTTERDWLRRSIPPRTLTRWKKRKIDQTLTDIRNRTTQQHGSDEDGSQREPQRAEPLTLAQEGEDVTRRGEERAEPFTLAHGSDNDGTQMEEQTAELLTLAQKNNEDAIQIQEQRAGSSTMLQDSVPQEVQDVHSYGLTEGQSIISILSFALKHNTTGVLIEDLLKLLRLHSAGSTAVPTSKYFLEKPLAGIADQFERYHYCTVCTNYIGYIGK
ncbi:uncharacterized protein LOC118469402 [Amphiprion ocellaris]|uniref:uncharacterized protein LOC118469402 n=1 Tax=Amphiprion ocellaris TaxID=80972 RepID=UPI00164A0C5E|nr:uncharacterized protein LOC118469402 [Amphiprion ocellaris]